MAVASLYPAIKPSLLLDFANTKKLDPRVNFTRSTTAAYYDGVTTAKAEENLLLNSVSPANAGWTWANGYTGSLGPELVTNGNFDTDSDWTKGTGWTISGGEATHAAGTGSALDQANVVTAGKWYKVTVDATATGGTWSLQFVGGTTTTVGSSLVSGSYTLYGFAGASNTTLRIFAGAATDLVIDNVSVKEVTPDSVTAPDGTSTASTFTADAADATFTQSVTAVAEEYTFSVYLRRVTGTGDIDIQCGGGTWVTQSITSSWARYTVTQTLTAGTRTPGIRIVTSGDQVEIWGAQLEQRSSATAYTPTTTQPITNYIPVLLTAPANVPRFDHNPTTGESLGLLIEQQRTNLVTYSADFADASWTKTRSSITGNTIVAPDGTLTGDKLVEDTSATATHFVSKNPTVSSGTAYTYSVYLKAAERTWAVFQYGSAYAWVNLSTGQLGTQIAATTGSFRVVDVGNGWCKCSVTWTTTSTSPPVAVYSATADNVFTYTGNDYSGIYIWGAQLETGAFPTSYIPTTSATVTRNADLVRMIGSNFSSWYNPGEGTFYFESIWSKPITTQIYVLSSGSSVRYIYDSTIVSSMGLASFDGTNVLGGGGGLSGFLKIVSSYSNASGTKQIASNGGTVYSGAYNGNFATNTTILFGETAFCGNFKKIAYYPQRLTDAQLQNLTK
jgi:hypothetical protein